MIDPVVDAIARTGLALLFATAALHKLRAPAHFRATLAAYRVLPAPIVPSVAWAVPGVEIATVIALATARAAGLVAAAATLLVYAAAMGVNLARGRRDLDCGCGGPAARRPIGASLVARNVVLATIAVATSGPVAARSLVWVDVLTLLGATATLATLYAGIDRLLAQAPSLARLRVVS